MLIKTLKTNRPAAYVSFFVTAFLFFLFDVVFENPSPIGLEHPLFSSIASFFVNYAIFSTIILFVLSLLLAMGWNNALSERGVFKNISILPAFFLVVLTAVFPLSSFWLCAFIMLFVLNKLMLCFQIDRPYGLLYDSGFLIGLATLINPTCIFFFILIYVSNIIYSAISWRNFIIPIIGLFTPFLFAWSYAFYFDSLPTVSTYYVSFLQWSIPKFDFSFALTLWSSLILIVFFLSIKELIQWLSMKSLRSRKGFFLLFAYCVCAFVGLFFTKDAWNYLLLFALPFSALTSNYFIFVEKRWWYESLFILIFITTVYLQVSLLQ